MLNLVFKDFIIQKKSVLFALLYIVFFMFAFQSIGQAMYPASVTAFSYILGMGAFALDDKNKTDVMFNCLPVKRSLLVTSKYVSVILFAAFGTLCYGLLRQILVLAQFPLQIAPVDGQGLISVLVSICIMSGISYPLIFKLGYVKAKVVNFVLIFAVFFNKVQNELNGGAFSRSVRTDKPHNESSFQGEGNILQGKSGIIFS